MELMDVIGQRRSIRKYRPDPVPQAKIDRVLEAARLAPSWANGQCCSFVVVTDPKVKRRLAESGNDWVEHAPCLVVACADPQRSGTKGDQSYYLLDVGIAMEHVVLAATDLGLGTCWIGWFDEHKARSALGAPKDKRVVAFTPLGYPDESPEPRPRKSLGELVSRDRWEQ
ncbi:MAG: nitroreductase family protein [Armatimonadetes bacterium]|nr:nitroreductase family protein [Armatimonadota bacterium]